MSNVLRFENASARGGVFNMEEGLSLEGVLIVRDLPRVSPSDYSSKWYDGTSEGS